MKCPFNRLPLATPLVFSALQAYAGHAGDMDSPGLMPHELLIGLVGLAGLVLLALLALAWVLRRMRRLERRLRDLEDERKP